MTLAKLLTSGGLQRTQQTKPLIDKWWGTENMTHTKSLNSSGVQRTRHKITGCWWNTEGKTHTKSLNSSGEQSTRHIQSH